MTSAAGQGSLDDIAVSELDGEFRVPDYQRGYRWGTHEVTQLLEDIRETQEERYYLQPVVVKRDGNVWELVDGQQRLTTLFLVAKYLSDRGYTADGPGFTLSYATREQSAAFLMDPNRNLAEKNVDFHHMFEAFTAIDEWAGAHGPDVAASLAEDLTKKVRLLWYEAPDALSGEQMFRRLNSGRIPLTNAELVKAMVVSRVDRPHELAAQWDAFERDLRAPEMWAFVAGGRAASSHIALLLDALADEYARPDEPRAPFHTFEAIRERIDAEPGRKAQAVWDEVVRLHSLVLGWCEDPDLYHFVGYLVATGAKTFGELVVESRSRSRSMFAKHLRWLTRRTLPSTWDELLKLSYEKQHQRHRLEQALLLMNVEVVRRARRERFPFAEHQIGDRSRVWTLEHIRPQLARPLGENARRIWLDDHVKVLEELADLSALDNELRADVLQSVGDATRGSVTQSAFEDLQGKILSLLDSGEFDPDETNAISNLALLARDENSALGNSAFEVKRRRIIDMDRRGRYIPLCTRNVFLKYYTREGVPHLHFWSLADREGYLAEMQAVLYGEGADE